MAVSYLALPLPPQGNHEFTYSQEIMQSNPRYNFNCTNSPHEMKQVLCFQWFLTLIRSSVSLPLVQVAEIKVPEITPTRHLYLDLCRHGNFFVYPFWLLPRNMMRRTMTFEICSHGRPERTTVFQQIIDVFVTIFHTHFSLTLVTTVKKSLTTTFSIAIARILVINDSALYLNSRVILQQGHIQEICRGLVIQIRPALFTFSRPFRGRNVKHRM